VYTRIDIELRFCAALNAPEWINTMNVRTGAGLLLFVLISVLRPALAPQTPSVPIRFEPRVIAQNLETVWALAFAPDGRLFLTERGGRIRLIEKDTLAPRPWATIPVLESPLNGTESGLMGLAVDPRFAENRRVYVCYSHPGPPPVNRIAVLTEEGGRGTRLTTLVDGIAAGAYHNGCRLKFGPDAKLYATIGDGYEPRALAQATEALAGKVLRLNPDGTVPNDNPFAKSYVWSYGHRNSQGLAFQPGTGRLFATEHGTGPGGNNELNVIEKGRNYGWPTVVGDVADPRFVRPIMVREEGPAGATFVTGARYPELRDNLLIATLSRERLLRVELTTGPQVQVSRVDVLIEGTYGSLRDVIMGPDGFIYIGTSNRDGHGGRSKPRPGDDKVIRLLPAGSTSPRADATRSGQVGETVRF
jgi:aldose sugar dehydrogenase